PAKIRTETANKRRMPSATRWATSFTMGEDISARPNSGFEPALQTSHPIHWASVWVGSVSANMVGNCINPIVEDRGYDASRHAAIKIRLWPFPFFSHVRYSLKPS
ncbi:hypothetical protein, partial [Mesorhizobium abyssinicae]|uniref:hypothetical protein n=1 Tax=Mesorhizobium abyssinicae TaxID=1209958 RepID=UPI003CEF142D